MTTAVAAPADRPSDEELLEAIEQLTLLELAELMLKFRELLDRDGS